MFAAMANEKENLVAVTDNHNSDDWVDTMVSCAQAVNKLFVHNTCRLCQVYSDKQVEFEQNLQEANSTSPVDRAFLRTFLPLHPEVEIYRQFLFDEDSVADSLGHRGEGTNELSSNNQEYVEDDVRTMATQRTQ